MSTDTVQETVMAPNKKPSMRSNYPSRQIEAPPDRVKQFLKKYLGPTDEFVATPLANFNVGDDIIEGRTLYSEINNSRYATIWHVGLFGLGILTLTAGHIVSVYRSMRNDEKRSNFFYFRRLLQSQQSDTVKEVMGQGKFDNDILSAAVYFYSPGISEEVCRKRRFFAWVVRSKEYTKLKKYLTHKGFTEKRTEKEILKDIFIETIDKLVKYLNKETTPSDSNLPEKFQRKGDTYSIGFSEKYSQIFFSKDMVLPEKPKKNVSLAQSILEAIGEASFLYWLCMFAFYFAPTIGVVAGLSFPPLALAFFFLAIRCVYIIFSFKKDSVNKQIRALNDEETNALEVATLKERHESDYVEWKKQEVFVEDRVVHKDRVVRIEFTRFKDSKLHKDLRKVLGKRHFMKAAAILDAFVAGCFFPFFGIWLFKDLFSVVLGLAIGVPVTGFSTLPVIGAIFMGIAAVTLVLGMYCGIKKAIKAGKEQDEKYEKLEKSVEELEKLLKDQEESLDDQKEVLDLSLYEYDRLFRRYSLEQPIWTKVKKLLNRAWVVISRLGTGSLVFRLIILGTITSFITVSIVALIAPPILISLIGAFGLFFAAWYTYGYNIEKKWTQAGNITNHFYLSKMAVEKEIEHQRLLDQEKRSITSSKDVRTPRLSGSGGESPDSRIITELNFNATDPSRKKGGGGAFFRFSRQFTSRINVSDSQLFGSNPRLKRAKSESSLEHCDLQDSKNSLKLFQELSPNGR